MRAIKDLRELITVSRLTFRESDDEHHDEDFFNLSEEMESKIPSYSLFQSNDMLPKMSSKVPVTSSKHANYINAQRDMMLLCRNSIPDASALQQSHKKPLPPLSKDSEKEELLRSSINELNTFRKQFQKESRTSIDIEDTDENGENLNEDIGKVEGNFDDLMIYIDASIVSDWLNRSNKELQHLYIWLETSKCESFIKFANFWLVSMKEKERRSLIEMEYSILTEEVSQAFIVGIESEKIQLREIHKLIRAVFKEYPLQFLSFHGLYLILDYLDILCSDRKDAYKKLLSDIKCRTRNKQYAQWLLSIRSFALIGVCSQIVKFFTKASEEETVSDILRAKSAPARSLNKSAKSSNKESNDLVEVPPVPTSCEVKYKLYKEAVFQHDYAEVLHYLISSKKCNPLAKDGNNRTLVFLAVMNEKPNILKYLIKRCPQIDVNEACDSGNTALHAAVNSNKLNMVEILLTAKNINVNQVNKNCMNASALHLSVWHNYEDIAIQLVRAKADPFLKMDGGQNAYDLANENGNKFLVEMFDELSKY